jgi:hypothetical protein
MATLAFIPYVPKPTNQKCSNKPPWKNVPKEFSNSESSRQIEQNSTVTLVDSELSMQKVNGDDGVMVGGMITQHYLPYMILMQVEPLTEISKSNDNGKGDFDDSYFPTIPKLVSSTICKDKLGERGRSKGNAPQATDKPALEESGHSIDPAKSTLGLNLEDSQDECANSPSSRISKFNNGQINQSL